MIEFTTEVKANVTPKQLAQLFAHMDNNQQAEFFNEVGRIAEDWKAGLCMQMCYVSSSDVLNATGRAVMEKIGEWGKEPAKSERQYRIEDMLEKMNGGPR